MVSIIMLVHKAKRYTVHSIKTLMETKNIDYELIVVDNDSDIKTKKALLKLMNKGYIDKLLYLKENTLFAKGNNIGSKLCDPKSEHILLLNSDVEIRNRDWLNLMLEVHEKGSTALGVCDAPYQRGDGYAFLIDKELYLKYQLDESFEWWWSVTKLQALLLKDGYSVKAVRNHNDILYHFGGMSGKSWKNAKGLNTEGEDVKKWFSDHKVVILPELKREESLDVKVSRVFHIINKLEKKLKR